MRDWELRKDLRDIEREFREEARRIDRNAFSEDIELRKMLYEINGRLSRLEGRFNEFRDHVIDRLPCDGGSS